MAKWTAVRVLTLAGSGCRDSGSDVPSSAPATKAAKKSPKYPARIHAKKSPETVARPDRPLDLAEAQRYFLKLVNRDRQAEGLEPVAWDPNPERAGPGHAARTAGPGCTYA